MKKSVVVLFVALVLASGAGITAQSLGIAAKAGTLGPGVELTTGLLSNLNARVGVQYLPLSRTGTTDEEDVTIEYTADLKMTSVDLFADFHPFRNAFRLTGGVIYNGNEVGAEVVPISSYTVGDKTFTPDKIGTLSARVDYGNKFSPYIGLGVGNAVKSLVGFSLDIGMMYTDSPNVTMVGTRLIAPTADQAAQIEEGFKTWRFYPVFSLGFSLGVMK